MKYVASVYRDGMLTIDGYSERKTFKGAVKDFAIMLKDYDEGESKALLDIINDYDEKFNTPIVKSTGYYDYMFNVEEVPCASYMKDNGEIKTSKGHYYLVIRFYKEKRV